MESILTSVKKMLGITEDYECFDDDIVMHINSVFLVLYQLGVGPDTGFSISNKYTNWSSFTENEILLEAVKSYMYLKVRMLFDPPSSNSAMNAAKSMIQELEWRLNSLVDYSVQSDEGEV